MRSNERHRWWLIAGLTAVLLVPTAVSGQTLNTVPVANGDSYTADEDSTLTVAAPGVLTNDTDVDGNALTVASPRPASGPSHGTLTLNADGSFTYTPAPNYSGTDSFTYKANDGTADSALAATVTITVNAVPDAPMAAHDSYSAKEDTTLTVIVADGVLKNDTDADGDALSVSGPAAASGPSNGTLLLNADGSFSYTPARDFSGTDSFTYKATDGTAESAAATVTIVVADAQEPPVAADDSYAVDEGKTLTVAAAGILANDTDPEGSALTVAEPRPASPPSHGTLTVNADGSFSYTPASGFVGTDTFTYKASDGTAASNNPATVTITVQAVNDAPVAVADSYSVSEDTTLTIAADSGVLKNDTDAEGDTLTVIEPRPISGPSHGTLTLNADGSFTYTPARDYFGNDAFAYKISDGNSESNTATVTINVSDVSDTPTELLSIHQNIPLVATLDNPCTSTVETIAFSGAVQLTQKVWQMPAGTLRLYVFEDTAMSGRDALNGGPVYAFGGESEMDAEFAVGSASLMMYKKVRSTGADDNFHAVVLLNFDPSTLKLDVKVEGACDDGQQ